MPRITKAYHARVVAAYRGLVARLQRQLAQRKPAKRRKRPLAPRQVPELVLYEATAAESADGFQRWEVFPVVPSSWVLVVQELIDGQVEAEGEVTVPAVWDDEPAPALVRREIRQWHEEQKQHHPEWGDESPRVTVTRLVLRASGAL